jgi:hypothetical protein
MTAAAASADTEGWQIATMCARGTELVHEGDEVVGVVLKAKAAAVDGNVTRAMLLSRSPPGTRISFKSTINCATCRVIGAAKRAAHVATVHQLFEHERRLGHRIA